MTTVRIGPPVVNATDVLDYALALLEEHGWRQGPRVPDNEDWPEVAKNGLSLHDSIGMACYVLSGESGTGLTRSRGSTGANSKDFPVSSRARDYGYAGTLREQATAFVLRVPGVGEVDENAEGEIVAGDIAFNDQADDAEQVLGVLRAAIEASEEATAA